MWDALFEICRREDTTVNALLTTVDRARAESSLTSAIRSYIVWYYRDAARTAEQKAEPQHAVGAGPGSYQTRAAATSTVTRS